MNAVMSEILTVFDVISTWFVGAVNDMIPIFYNTTDSTLTFVGTLAVAGLGIGVILLVLNRISDFLRFRG